MGEIPFPTRHSFTFTLRRDGTANVTQSEEPSGSFPPELAAMLAGMGPRRALRPFSASRDGNAHSMGGITEDGGSNAGINIDGGARTVIAGGSNAGMSGSRTGMQPPSREVPLRMPPPSLPRIMSHMAAQQRARSSGASSSGSAGASANSTGQADARANPTPMDPELQSQLESSRRRAFAFMPVSTEHHDNPFAGLIETSPGSPASSPAFQAISGMISSVTAARANSIRSGQSTTVPSSGAGASSSDQPTPLTPPDVNVAFGDHMAAMFERMGASGTGDGPVQVQVEVHPGMMAGNPANILGAIVQGLAAMQGPQLKPASSHQLDVLLDSHCCTLGTTTGEETVQCPICQEQFAAGEHMVKMPCCGNQHHRSCILRWLGKESVRCPVCRQSLPEAPTTPADLSDNTIAELKRRCTERNLDCSNCLEKRELVALLLQERQQQQERIASRPTPRFVEVTGVPAPPPDPRRAQQQDLPQNTPPSTQPATLEPRSKARARQERRLWADGELEMVQRRALQAFESVHAPRRSNQPQNGQEIQVPQPVAMGVEAESSQPANSVPQPPASGSSQAPSVSASASSSSNSDPASSDSQATGRNKRQAPETPVRRRITGKRPRPN